MFVSGLKRERTEENDEKAALQKERGEAKAQLVQLRLEKRDVDGRMKSL